MKTTHLGGGVRGALGILEYIRVTPDCNEKLIIFDGEIT